MPKLIIIIYSNSPN